MILLFEPEPPSVRWCLLGRGDFVEYGRAFGLPQEKEIGRSMNDRDPLEAVGYVLVHGGEVIKQSGMPLTDGALDQLEKCVPLFPEYNEMTLKLAQHWMAKYPRIPHFLFCDTSFFLDLPAETSTYAVPYALCEQGVRRYGGYGIFHEYAWERLQAILPLTSGRLISVFLGDSTNVAAIRDGKPMETSIGFTPVEGVISSTSCGDLDPTIVFQLLYSGMSFSDINRLLTQASGFSGLLGKLLSFQQLMVHRKSHQADFARQKLLYDLEKYIGGFIPVLGGVDVIAFQSEYIEQSDALIRDIMEHLAFLGLTVAEKPRKQAGYSILTRLASTIQVITIQSTKADIIGHKIKKLIREEKPQ